MLYIIEGLDKCGKSTFIDKHEITHRCEGLDDFVEVCRNTEGTDNVVVHFDKTDTDPVESLKCCAAMSTYCNVFMDRCWMSEIAYGNVFRNGPRIKPVHELEILRCLSNTPHMIFYFSKRIAALDYTDEYEDITAVESLKKQYEDMISTYARYLNIYRVEAIV